MSQISPPIERTTATAISAENATFSVIYFYAFFVNASIAFMATLAGTTPVVYPYIALSTPFAIGAIIYAYRKTSILVSPATIFLVVWMTLVPVTAVAVPLMDEMAPLAIAYCSAAAAIFSLAGVVVHISVEKTSPRPAENVEGRPSEKNTIIVARIAAALLLISILALVANIFLEGRVALFDIDSSERKAVAQFIGYPLLSSAGTVSLATYAWLGRVSRRQALLCAIFVALQLLTAQRWVAIVGLTLAVVVFASRASLSRRIVGSSLALLLAVYIAFSFVASFRGGEADHERYFISTGRYSGDPSLLQSTEIVRYFGMSQRNLIEVLSRPFEFERLGAFSFSPLSSFWEAAPTGLGTSISGYTANNILAYLYTDFGAFWPFALLALSTGCHLAFVQYRINRSLSHAFVFAVFALGLATSFFAYVNAYSYWVLTFPLLVLLIQQVALVPKTKST